MRIYQDDALSSYEKMRRSAPSYYDDVTDVQAIWQAEGHGLDQFKRGLVSVIQNVIIRTADEEHIAKYESFFGVRYFGGIPNDLEFRRNMVAARLIGMRHIGAKEILGIASLFAPGQASLVDFYNSCIFVFIDGDIPDEESFLFLLSEKIPAHLALRVTVCHVRRFVLSLGICRGSAIEVDVNVPPPEPCVSGKLELGVARSTQIATSGTVEPSDPREIESRQEMGVGRTAMVEGSAQYDMYGPPEYRSVLERGVGRMTIVNDSTLIEPCEVAERTTTNMGMGRASSLSSSTQADPPSEPTHMAAANRLGIGRATALEDDVCVEPRETASMHREEELNLARGAFMESASKVPLLRTHTRIEPLKE